MSKYNIGDKAWYANIECITKSMLCPDCQGKKFLRVILGDDSEVTIDCAGCTVGFDPPRGMIKTYNYEPLVKEVIIEALETTLERGVQLTRYSFYQGCRITEEKLFATQQEAETATIALVAEYAEQERKRLAGKKKPTRTWTWNVHYYRAEIRRAKETIIQCEAKLAVAPPKSIIAAEKKENK